MKNMKRIALVVAITLLLGCAIGGTLAWLTDSTETVTNTFTSSDVDIELKEHTYDPTSNSLTSTETNKGVDNYKMVPGITLPKDPKVTVMAGSEDCYVFVEVTPSNNYSTYFDAYVIDSAYWTPLGNTYPNVYYKEVTGLTAEGATNLELPILTNNAVVVKGSIGKTEMALIDGKDADGNADNDELANRPTLTFKAYAIQKNHLKDGNNAVTTAEGAWKLVKPAN